MSFESYCSIYNLGHRAVRDLLNYPVYVTEKVDGCVSLTTRILTANLEYVEAGSLKVGDRLIGFDDTLNDPRLRRSIVTAAQPIKKQCAIVRLVDGRLVTASLDHPWLVRQSPQNKGKKWVTTQELKPGMRIVSLPAWEEEKTWESGYLAGMFDGEGSLVRSGNQRVLSFYQRESDTLEIVAALLQIRQFECARSSRQRKVHYQRSGAIVIRGGWTNILRLLGTVRPSRLLAKAESCWANAPMNFIPDIAVDSVELCGEQEVMGLSTSTKTYIAEGLLSHNSQFSFGMFPPNQSFDGGLRVRSKGTEMLVDAPEKMFTKAVLTAKQLQHLLVPGWTYRAEYLAKPTHNTLAYDRVPTGHLILFDVSTDDQGWLDPDALNFEADRLGLECVPVLWRPGMQSNDLTLERLRYILDNTTSVLGGQLIEGVVIKPLVELYGIDKKTLMGKFVSERFKEAHKQAWKVTSPASGDILDQLTQTYRVEARWMKSIQHLREAGLLQDMPQDIPALIIEVQKDLGKEEKENIERLLWKWAIPHLSRAVVKGLPEFYKTKVLLPAQFEKEDKEEVVAAE